MHKCRNLIGHKASSKDNSFSFLLIMVKYLIISTPSEITNQFNLHFSNIDGRINNSTPISAYDSFQSFLNQLHLQSTSFLPSSPLEMIKVAYFLNTSRSCGIYDIDPCIKQ